MTIILFDTPQIRKSFYPFSLTHPICDLRCGIFTMRERWEKKTKCQPIALTENYLNELIPVDSEYLYINAAVYPSESIFNEIINLKNGCILKSAGEIVAINTNQPLSYPIVNISHLEPHIISNIVKINNSWHLLSMNETCLIDDYRWIIERRQSYNIDRSNIIFNEKNVFIEDGAQVLASTINATNGPVYIGKDSNVMEGSAIRGPVAIGERAVLKMGARIYGTTSIGPASVVGGEIKNSIIMANSNKAHDGYLGDSIIGEWCNIGAGTSNSNVKNTAGYIKIWDEENEGYALSDMIKAGVLIGDFSRCAINTSFNTGTVIGASCNVFGNECPPKHLPSFSWGRGKYILEKCIIDIERWMQMKGSALSTKDIEIITYLYHHIKSPEIL